MHMANTTGARRWTALILFPCKSIGSAVLLLSILGWGPLADARSQGSCADYDRALSLAKRTENTLFRSVVKPQWLPGNTCFWYRIQTGPEAHEYIRVSAETGERQPALDHPWLANALGHAVGTPVLPTRLPLDRLRFQPDAQTVKFRAFSRSWIAHLARQELLEDTHPSPPRNAARLAEPRPSRRTGDDTTIAFVNQSAADLELFWIDSEGERRSYGRVRAGQRREQHTFAGHVWLVTDAAGRRLAVFEATEEPLEAQVDGRETELPPPTSPEPTRTGPRGVRSPDGRWEAFIRDRNLHLRHAGTEDVDKLSADGSDADGYSPQIEWSPDSRHVVAVRVQRGQERMIHFVESSPRDQLQPKLHERPYLKPGDRLPKPRLRLFEIESRRQTDIPDDLYPNPFTENGEMDVRWAPDSRRFTFLYNERGHQRLRVLAVDAATGRPQTLLEETNRTFIDYSGKLFLHWLDDTGELLWMSERDGWNHLYRIDSRTGALKNQVTRGPWVVRQVEHVDPVRGQIWFFAGGIHPHQDPYHLHLGRVNFDGSDLRVLTDGDGTHRIEFSPDRRFFLDTWSRVDHPPVIDLRRADDGKKLCELERADATALIAAGWTVPERFVAPGRDGHTPIHGILIRPSHFDPSLRYPVLEEIYAGPQGAHVPKDFGRLLRPHTLAELGFVVVQIDGMGTSYRSKAFHDVCWKNLADAGFPDRRAWIQAAAAARPWMDLGRVGLYGGSAGGQNALRGLLTHGDFYRAAVADCGCHDNRMDKIWWNEQWMGWPPGPEYAANSNVTDAHRLQGKLLLVVGELDDNVDPASTLQVVHALQKADKDFDLLIMTGTGHGAAETPYASRRRMDFFVRHLHGREPRW